MRLTDDHSLVDELLRQGRLTPEEAVEHPQRSVITRALGPEAEVEVDTRSFRARAGDVYLLCSDGLTTMVAEAAIAELLQRPPRLADAGEALIAAANEAGGRDNITVILFRLEEVELAGARRPRSTPTADRPAGGPTPRRAASGRSRDRSAALAVPPAPRRTVRRPRRAARPGRRERATAPPSPRCAAPALLAAGAGRARRARRRRLAGAQTVYFIGTNNRGLVTLYKGLPVQAAGRTSTCTRSRYVSGRQRLDGEPARRSTLLNHSCAPKATPPR